MKPSNYNTVPVPAMHQCEAGSMPSAVQRTSTDGGHPTPRVVKALGTGATLHQSTAGCPTGAVDRTSTNVEQSSNGLIPGQNRSVRNAARRGQRVQALPPPSRAHVQAMDAYKDLAVSLNINGLQRRLAEVRNILRIYQFPILGLCETHIREPSEHLLTVHNYNCLASPADPLRGLNRGRHRCGLIIYFHQALPAYQFPLPEIAIEALGLKVKLTDGNEMLIIFAYIGHHVNDFR